jgi:hypothetical protein
MHFRDVVPLSARFRHVCRALEPGERLPQLPSLSEQLMACRAELERQTNTDEDEGWDVEEELAQDDE